MARLILTESRVEESITKTDNTIPFDKTSAKDSDIDKKSVQPEIPLSVSADDLIVFHQPDLNMLRVQYMLRNTGSKAHAIAGKGRHFSIFNLKTMKFRANDQTGPGQFNIATVYIYSTTGKLLLEKNFPIGIKFKTLPAPKKKKSVRLPDKKKITTVSPPKTKKPEVAPALEKKPSVTPLKEKKKPDTSLETDKQTAPSPDETVDTETR